ncbi:MAG: molybdopterin-dependent oxidoreductase [Nitrospirae bacterium]|nr:molybdopterin-dependent oxidoreductase [Candidatus Manganitrophaceae bacterium]
MRALRPFGRRAFLKKALLGTAGFVLSLVTSRGRAEAITFWSNSDYVGKTREGEYKDFYIQYYKSFKRIDGAAWRLKVGGRCEAPQTLTLGEVKALPGTSQVSRIKCVECWSNKAEWSGFHLSELEKLAHPGPEAVGILFRCGDGYTEYLSRAELLQERVLLVHTMNGRPLSDEHGFPLRLIIPFKYGYKSAKAILGMEYVDTPKKGTWSEIGPYSVDGTILPGEDHPLDRGKVKRRIDGGEIFD